MKRYWVLTVLLVLPSAWPAPAATATTAAPDPFYQNLLREGIQDFDLGDFAASARTLRIACFGMLDQPPALAGCLSRLALAQDKAGDSDGFQETFRRIVEIEERFAAYTKAELSPEARSALEQRLAVRIPAATLRSIPAFRNLADRRTQTSPTGREPKRRRGEPSGGSSSDNPPTAAAPRPPATAPATVGSNGAAEPAGSATSPPHHPEATSAPAEITAQERADMAQARRLLDLNSKIKELRQAFDLARRVAEAHSGSVEAQHLAAEAAYRISRWQDAARYFRRGGEPAEDKPELQFYMAVALFESGDAQGAAAILRRSLPNLQRTPYVDAYARKILG